jgi:hypothetical protein
VYGSRPIALLVAISRSMPIKILVSPGVRSWLIKILNSAWSLLQIKARIEEAFESVTQKVCGIRRVIRIKLVQLVMREEEGSKTENRFTIIFTWQKRNGLLGLKKQGMKF